ncbi:hypothetical protein DBR43_15630 [Pedobacter sp. KBW06]|uniref:hypothetical protein n=1 Tax=Pedobacter sp. KBW06 TaxID=2153359 RepID=UPI000F5ACB2B|nr:hypothetical protein [Pedobacter sp. KBW06]RQO69506.1 hypothetical protein DBR43_15630 [Pedobacter sp. KBW06]
MNRVHLLILLLFASFASFSQERNKVSIGYIETYEKLPEIRLQKTSAAEYEQHKPGKTLVKLKLKETKSQFQIRAKGKQYWFKKYDPQASGDGFKGFGFFGYFPKLKMYVLSSNATSEHLGFSDLILLDSLSNYRYTIVSIGDAAVETPVPSVNSRYLLYFYNEVYNVNNCTIAILKVNDRKVPSKLLTEYQYFKTDKWSVDQVRWIDDHSFLIKALVSRKENSQRSEHFEYYKAQLN